MGKKKGTAGSSATAGADKVSLDWSASTISKREENKLRSLGLISSAESDFLHPENALADQLYEKVLDLKNAEGQTMCGTEVVSVFLKRRVQPLMSRAHQLWMYTSVMDKSRISSTDLSEDDLRDEASTVAQCYPPTPESGAAPEDDDASEETEDEHHIFEDIDVLGDEAPEDDAFVKSMRRRKINEDLMATAESSPSGRDDDANATTSPAPSQEMLAPQVAKGSTKFFADEDDLELTFSEDDDDVPLSKRAKILSGKAKSAKESIPSTAELTLPPRTSVAKFPLSTINPSASASAPPVSHDHPIFATVDAVADFADQFTRLESENVQLRKAVKTSADQVLEANRLTTEAQNENTVLKDELKRFKKKMKDEQEARRKAFIEADEKEGAL
ncbi:hypothetical protein QYE76_066921 [Lolium multiflorum]|uniref:Uncharacterized protein n=1 Tax=Lolium multiflorum TaxID=4521 RepID=A0AAD8SBF9_LOLMU|nr:hypothetical protein QYE76_066921 [Lolium multiflorum]